MKIRVGHLRGGKAQIMSTVPVTGSVKPFVPGQRVEVTFYLNGSRIETQKVEGQRRHVPGPDPDRGGRQVRGQRPPPGRQGPARRRDRAQELAGRLPRPASGAVRRRRDRLQEGDAEDGLHRQQRPLLRRQDRPRRARLPQSQRDDAQLARRQGPGQARLRRQGRIRGPSTRTPANTSRRRSPSRSWSSPRATSRSPSTRSPRASPRPRP